MQDSFVALGSSSSRLDDCNPMDLQEDDSYFAQPLLLSERLGYVDTQAPYYDTLQSLANEESATRSARIPAELYRYTAPAFDLGLSTDLFQRDGFRDGWRYDTGLEAHGQSFAAGFQPLPARCLNQESVYHIQPTVEKSFTTADTSDAEACKEDTTSSTASPKIDSSPVTEVWPFVLDEPAGNLCAKISHLSKDSHDEEDGPGDKPYARLIHEALMQAPGHRMMLREIYDWFVKNTTKPSESGTNGWQNSIRHNLSMNQAFENDRTDPTNPGHQARKANSVWILTDDAIRHGVQSTTRYRKHGSNKKSNRSRIPAPLRQRSGAKGGRAARRAARLRREEQMHSQGSDSVAQGSRVPNVYGLRGTDRTSLEADSFSVASPLTPDNEPAFAFPQSSAGNPCYYHLPGFYDLNPESLPGQIEAAYEGEPRPKADSCMKEVLSYPYNSPPQPVSR